MIHGNGSIAHTYCTTYKQENGIIRFEFSAIMRQEHKTRVGLDEFFAAIDQCYNAARPDETLRFLIVIEHSGISEINYSIDQTKKLYARHPKRPPTRTAMVVQQDHMARLLDTFIQLLHQKRDKVRFFGLGQRASAEDWLLRSD